jgi:broad specificity phosphatase PhoE
MKTLYVIRHAQASFGSENYDELSDLGTRQASILGEHLADEGPAFDRVYCGAMKRQQATAHVILSHIEKRGAPAGPHLATEFNECDPPSIIRMQVPEMIREAPSIYEDLQRIYTDPWSLNRVFEWAMTRWASGRCDLPGVETWEEFITRVRDGVTRVMSESGPQGNVLVLTSGGAISAVMQMAEGLSDEDTICLALGIHNASVSAFTWDRRTLKLSFFNSIRHFETLEEPDLITYR